MKYQFKQTAKFSHDAQAKIYTLGVHDVPAEVENHHYFKTLKKAGLVVEEGKDKPASVNAPKSLQEHNAKLAKQMDEEKVGHEPGDVIMEDDESDKKHHKGKKK